MDTFVKRNELLDCCPTLSPRLATSMVKDLSNPVNNKADLKLHLYTVHVNPYFNILVQMFTTEKYRLLTNVYIASKINSIPNHDDSPSNYVYSNFGVHSAMSLFKTRSFWSTQSEDDEYFDQNSMIITALNGDSDYILTGSQSGVLRILKPSCDINENHISGFVPSDLVIEKIFDQPILQLGYGRLVSGSLIYQTVVLNPRLLSVYLLKIKEGVTEHGTQNTFELLYDHHLQRSAANFTIGRFGGSQNRDFICVQSLDGMLSFFEQENPTFCCFLSDFLLPTPIVYVKRTDCFVMGTNNWWISSFKYNTLSEAGEGTDDQTRSTKNIIPVWSYSLGESIVDIQVVEDTVNKINYITILGERNLFCLFDSGRLDFMKKLEYSPVCFEAYTLKENLFCLVVSETCNLLVYERTTLKWSAKLDFLPICISTAFLKTIKGALVLLSEEGRLECAYLGTEPNLFVAPPLLERELDLEKVEEELRTLNQRLKETYGNDLKFANQNLEKEILIKANVNQNLELCTFKTNLIDCPHPRMCSVVIEVIPQIAFDELQVTVSVSNPLKVYPSTQFYIMPEEAISFNCYVYLYEDLDVSSLKMNIIATVISSLGVPRSFNRNVILPLKLIVDVCTPQKDGEHKITLNVNQPVVPLLNLFPEFAEETKTSSAIAFKSMSTTSQPVTVLLAKSSERYRIQSSSLASLGLIGEEMILRLKKHYYNIDDFKVSFSSSLPSNELIHYVKKHFTKREAVFQLEEALDQLGAQFRIIQKRLITKFKVKNPTPLTNLDILMKDTHSEIIKTVQDIHEANKELCRSQIELTCALNLIANLIKIMSIDEKLKEILVSVFCPVVVDMDAQNWEDVMDSNLCHLLRTVLAKSEKDRLRISQTNVEKVTDITKMEKHIAQVLERISKLENSVTSQLEDKTEEEPTDSTLLEEEQKPVGSQFGEASVRLLSARRSLLRKRRKNDEEEKEEENL